MKSLKSFLVVGEKNIFAELAEITTIAAQTNVIIKRMFKLGYGDEKGLVENMHAIHILEKKSDEVAFKLTEDITSGAVSPNILDTLLESAHVADNIIDTHYYLSRELARMGRTKLPDSYVQQDGDWIHLFESMFTLADQSISKLKQMLTSSSVSEILQLRKDIEKLEEDGDDVKDSGFDKLYISAPTMHFLQFYNYSELLHKSDDVLDGCEDLSDLIVSIVTSVLK